jgi:hypothetical protein
MLVVLGACAPKVEPDAGENSTGAAGSSSSTGAAATTATLDGSGTGNSTGTASDASSTSSDGGEGFPATDDGVKLDAGPSIATCEAANSELIDLEITTPDGPLAAMHAWWGWDNCCFRKPWLVVTEAAPLEVTDGVLTTSPYVFGYVIGLFGEPHRGPYVGELAFTVGTDAPQATALFMSGFELLEPLDPDAPPEREQPRFSATMAVEAEGWSMQGSVQALHCPALDTQPCPCE